MVTAYTIPRTRNSRHSTSHTCKQSTNPFSPPLVYNTHNRVLYREPNESELKITGKKGKLPLFFLSLSLVHPQKQPIYPLYIHFLIYCIHIIVHLIPVRACSRITSARHERAELRRLRELLALQPRRSLAPHLLPVQPRLSRAFMLILRELVHALFFHCEYVCVCGCERAWLFRV